jgi:hypothetical protein
MVEIGGQNAPATDLMVKVVAAAEVTYVVVVKALAPYDAAVEEDVLAAAFVNSPDAYLKGMVKEASLVIQLTTMAD